MDGHRLGVRHGGWVQAVTTVLKLVPLLAIATIPRSTIIGTLVTTLVYILGTVAVTGLLLAGIPIYVWMRWRGARAPTEAEPLTVEELLPSIPDKPPVTR